MSAKYTVFDHSLLPQYKERFDNKIIKDSGIGPDGDCWDWKAGKDKDGYANFSINGIKVRAHRMSFFFAHGYWPEPMCLHSCDMHCCTNPAHLSEGTAVENTMQAIKRKRLATGDRSGSRTRPERLRRGDNHPSRLYPERRPRGAEHWTRQRLSIKKGRIAKLSESQAIQVLRMYNSGDYSSTHIAKLFDITDVTVSNIATGKTWKHLQTLIA